VQCEQQFDPACVGAGRFIDSGGVYKLAFGPKAFIVVSDPVVVRHLLKARHLRCLCDSASHGCCARANFTR